MKKILVIDDERDVLEVVRSVLKTKGYTVRCAEGGEEGLRQAESEDPDLIICDLMMPRISGLEVLKRLRAKPKFAEKPFIILSAVGEGTDKDESYYARGLGVDDYIYKPFDPLDLLGRVEYVFRRGSYRSTQGNTPSPTRPGEASRTPVPSSTPADLSGLSPVGLVRIYVDTWNVRDWETEYRCMDPAIVGAFPLDDYKQRRDQAFFEDGGRRTQRIAEIVDEYTLGEMGRVTCEREDSQNGMTTRKRVVFSLKRTPGGWKISRFKEEPSRPGK